MTSNEHSPVAGIGVIGLGNMGTPMVRNLLAAMPGRVTVHGRSRERAAALLDAGAVWAETPRDLADRSRVVLLMVPDLPDVEALAAGPDGLLAGDGALVIAVGATVSPVGVREFATYARRATDGRVRVIDTPVSGGVEGAAAGTLSIMIGGDADAVAVALPFLHPLGRPVHLGPIGAGAVAKACNQMIVGATVLALAESAVLAERSGIDLATLFDVLGGGYAASRVLETRAQRFVEHDHAPSGPAKYMLKDLGFASAVAEATETHAVLLPALRTAFAELVDGGYGDQDLAVAQAFVEER